MSSPGRKVMETICNWFLLFGFFGIRLALDHGGDQAGITRRQDFDAGLAVAQLAGAVFHGESPGWFVPAHG